MRMISILLCLLWGAIPTFGQELKFDVMSVQAEPTAPTPVEDPIFRFDVLHVAPIIALTSTKRPDPLFHFDLLGMPLHGSSGSPSPGPAVAIPPADTDRRPVVLVYVAPPDQVCTVCERMKKEITEEKEVAIAFDFKSPAPAWVEAYPTLHWQTPDGKWKYFTGWKGLREFEALYDRTAATAKPVQSRQTSNSYPVRTSNWSHPGNTREAIIQHLLTGAEHRGKFTRAQLERLSTSELESLHSDDHDGRVQWSRLPASSATRYSPRVVGAVAALGYRHGSTAASVAMRVEQVFVANVQPPPTQLIAAANWQGASSREAKESKKGFVSTARMRGSGFANS